MANYPIPPWLNPSAAQGYGALAGEAARAGLSADLARERMSQDAAQFSIESQQKSQEIAAANQAKQEQLNYEHQLEQQKNAVDAAYKQQQIGLQTSDLELAQKQFDLKTQDAAKKFTANQAFQKAMLPKDQGGEGLSPTQAALKYMAPYMTGTEVGRLSGMDKPPAIVRPAQDVPGMPGYKAFDTGKGTFELRPTIPQTITNAPPAIPQTDAEGNVIGNIIQLPGEKPQYHANTSTGTDLNSMIKKRQEELAKGKKSTAVDYKSADDVRAAYRAKKLTAEEASKILKDKFGFE